MEEKTMVGWHVLSATCQVSGNSISNFGASAPRRQTLPITHTFETTGEWLRRQTRVLSGIQLHVKPIDAPPSLSRKCLGFHSWPSSNTSGTVQYIVQGVFRPTFYLDRGQYNLHCPITLLFTEYLHQ